MSFSITKEGDRVIVGIPDQLVRNNRLQLKRRVDEEVSRGERKFLLDFSQTGYIDNSGMTILLYVSSVVRQRRGQVQVTGLNEELRHLFELTKFDTLFSVGEWGDGLAGQPARLKPKPPGPLQGWAAEWRPDVPPPG
jgi:anti-sigma B factor antagonist